MPRGIRNNVVGKKFNKLTVLEEISKNGVIYCRCQCECGQEKIIKKWNITSNTTKSCGHCRNNIIGKKQGMLTVINEIDQKTKSGKKIYLCKCECGNQKLISLDSLNAGTKSCGCLVKQKKYDNMIGKKFGKLCVIEEVAKTKYGQRQFMCQCECGQEKIILGANLLYGESTSCGCNKGYVENTKINLLKIKKAYSNSKSGIKGVYQDKKGGWHAMITVCKNRIFYYGGTGSEGKEKCINWRENMVEKYHTPLIEKYSKL